MNYRITLLILVFLSGLCFTACDTKEEPVEVGFLIHAFDKERWENDRDYFVEDVQEFGGTVKVMDAENDADKQLAQAKELLANGVDVLVVVPVDQFAAAAIVEAAHAQDVKVISYDRLIKNCKLDYYVSTDNVEIGSLQANYLATIQPQGEYALIGGAISDNNSQLLYLGQRNILQPLVERGDIEIVYNEFTEAWEEKEGYEHAKKLLKNHPGVNAILAGNDDLAMGVIRAISEANVDHDILVAGMDADLRNLREIVAGKQTCTVYKPYEKLAATAADLAMKLARGEDGDKSYQTVSNGELLVPTVFHTGMIVNKENLQLTVISEGYQREEEVYN